MGENNVIPFKRGQKTVNTPIPLSKKLFLMVPRKLMAYVGHTAAIIFADLDRISKDENVNDSFHIWFEDTPAAVFFWVRLPLKWWSQSLGISVGTLRKCLAELEAMGHIVSHQDSNSFDKSKWYRINEDRNI